MSWSENRALRAVRAVLSADGTRRLALGAVPTTGEALLRVRYGKSESILAPLWAGEGFPKDVKLTIDQLAVSPRDVRHTPVIVARRLSTGARALLDSQGISWVDEDGRAAISADPGLVVLRDAPSASTRRPTEVMGWSSGRAAVAEHLLVLPGERDRGPEGEATALPSVVSISADIGLSAPSVSRALQAFDVMGWTRKEGTQRGSGAHRTLVDATGMLSSWAGWHSVETGKVVHTHATFRDADTFVTERIAAAWPQGRWALTGWLALERRAPFMTTTPVIALYVDRAVFADPTELDQWICRAGLRRVDTGARVDLLEADPYVLRGTPPDAATAQVSDIRLYGDLLRLGVRGEDAAEHLRETRIGF